MNMKLVYSAEYGYRTVFPGDSKDGIMSGLVKAAQSSVGLCFPMDIIRTIIVSYHHDQPRIYKLSLSSTVSTTG